MTKSQEAFVDEIVAEKLRHRQRVREIYAEVAKANFDKTTTGLLVQERMSRKAK